MCPVLVKSWLNFLPNFLRVYGYIWDDVDAWSIIMKTPPAPRIYIPKVGRNCRGWFRIGPTMAGPLSHAHSLGAWQAECITYNIAFGCPFVNLMEMSRVTDKAYPFERAFTCRACFSCLNLSTVGRMLYQACLSGNVFRNCLRDEFRYSMMENMMYVICLVGSHRRSRGG